MGQKRRRGKEGEEARLSGTHEFKEETLHLATSITAKIKLPKFQNKLLKLVKKIKLRTSIRQGEYNNYRR